jgi:hypothetical protein
MTTVLYTIDRSEDTDGPLTDLQVQTRTVHTRAHLDRADSRHVR